MYEGGLRGSPVALDSDVIEIGRVDMRRGGKAKAMQSIFTVIYLAVKGPRDATVLLGVVL